MKQTARATPSKATRHTRASAALDAPPSPTSVHFEDAEELQEILAEVTARPAVQDAGASSEAVVAASGIERLFVTYVIDILGVDTDLIEWIIGIIVRR